MMGIVAEDRRHFLLVAHRGTNPEFVKFLTENPPELDPDKYVAARAIVERQTLQVEDLADPKLYGAKDQHRNESVALEGVRTALCVPMLLSGESIGVLFLYRREVNPFSDEDKALVETFAAQAVIAVENVRQFREVQERLEREQASGEVLGVISESRDDEIPVFETILKNAARLCGAPLAFLTILEDDGDHFVTPTYFGEPNSKFAKRLKSFRGSLSNSTQLVAEALRLGEVTRIDDISDTDLYRNGDKWRVELVEVEGIRSVLLVPLISGERTLGTILLYRREVMPFTPDHVSIAQTFAAQAVIAIENVQQFREVQTRLERETATSEILEVMSTSRDNTEPVFEVIVRNAAKLCNAPFAQLDLVNETCTHTDLAAHFGPPLLEFKVGETSIPLDSGGAMAAAIRECRTIHIGDLRDTDLYRQGDALRVKIVEEVGLRTVVAVPLILGTRTLGCITLFRLEHSKFAEADIKLVETFAAQAVIAIENVRQFREVQDRLKREAATAEVLHVISQSRDNEQPVFDIILDRARNLCEATHAGLLLATPSDPTLRRAATSNKVEDVEQVFRSEGAPNDPDMSYAAKAIRDGKTLHLADMGESELYMNGSPLVCGLVDEGRIRSVIFAPLMGKKSALGVMALFRLEVRPFNENQIKLVETFASQAVIAIENVRQFKALESLNAELGERVDEQVGEIERMGKLKRFLPAAVADTVVSQGSEKMLSSHRALLGVLFCDIRGFTAFCETAEPEETIEVLQTYHEEMGKLINQFGAGVDHRMGDGIMVLFNDPVPCDDPAGEAVRLAIAMRAHMSELAQKWKKLGHRLGFGVGVSLGYATVGMVGYEGRYDYTASGTAVNLAARLCDRADDGEILLSPRAQTAVEDEFATESAGEFDLKGMREPVEVFRLKQED